MQQILQDKQIAKIALICGKDGCYIIIDGYACLKHHNELVTTVAEKKPVKIKQTAYVNFFNITRKKLDLGNLELWEHINFLWGQLSPWEKNLH